VCPDTAPLHVAREIVIVGGGCYGTFYARQLERAQARGALAVSRILVVDRDPACQVTRELPPAPNRELVAQDWDAFFDRYLETAPRPRGPAAPPSYIVPSPLMPHLMFDWLLRRARALWPGRSVQQEPLAEPVGTPYDTLAPDGTRYVSWADWLCPTHCIEPALCPIIRAPRTWEMSETATSVAARLSTRGRETGTALFVTRHLTDGVGAFAVDDALAAAELLAAVGGKGGPAGLLVGTVSACHGALGLLALG
jgi:hypothetical protein